jgi:two-component system chemotaxis response regulator CheB
VSINTAYKHRVVIGTSAGGVHALKNLITPLPADFTAPIFIVMHLQASPMSYLPDIMNRYSQLPALHPTDGETIQSSHIYIAPPNLHMIISNNKIMLLRTKKINYCRPAIDPLFHSAAPFGPATIGVLLSGMLHDGVAGLLAIKNAGGTTIVQDLDEAEFKDMPENALKQVPIDYCLPTQDIAKTLITLIKK